MLKNNIYLHTVSSISKSKGGPSRSVTGLCNALSVNGATVDLLTINDSLDKCYPSSSGVKVYESPKEKFSTGFNNYLNNIYKKSKPIILHDHGLWLLSNYWSSNFAKKHDIPFFLSPRGMLEPWSLNNKRYKKKAARFFYQNKILENVSVFFATSSLEAENIRKLGYNQPIAVIPNGVDIVKKNKRDTLNKKVLFLSRIHPKKGLINLVKAWSQAAQEGWILQIAGNDDCNYTKEVANEIQKLGISETIEFLGSLDGEDKSEAFKNADLFVLPTFSENFGIVVAEALSHALPVITTTGAPWQSLLENNCGWWVDPSVEGVSQALSEAMSMSINELNSMGERGQVFAGENFSWSSIAEQSESVYQWVLRGGSVPKCIV